MKIDNNKKVECHDCNGVGVIWLCLGCEKEDEEQLGSCSDYTCNDDTAEEDCHTCDGTGEITLREHVDNQY